MRISFACWTALLLLPALLLLTALQRPPEPPTYTFLPAPGGHGFVVAVESAAPEATVYQCRAQHRCWALEGGLVDTWYPGDRLFVLEVFSRGIGLVEQRQTPIGPPQFWAYLPQMTGTP